ncbi:MAG TPA: hypothetical protein VHW65_13635 [Gemmatimonadales bacterium]|jgi:hypothetical protein|nr:hypothetical protein [Gemmatimonadales bacterium]
MQIKVLRGFLMAAPMAWGLAMALPSAAVAQAQTSGTRFGVEAALGNNSVGIGAGAFVKFHLTDISGHPITGRATFDYFFSGGNNCDGCSSSFWDLSADGLYDIANAKSDLKPYVGAGISYFHASVSYTGGECIVDGINYCAGASYGGSTTNLHIAGGINFMSNSKLMPFAEVKYELGNGGELFLKVGIHLK